MQHTIDNTFFHKYLSKMKLGELIDKSFPAVGVDFIPTGMRDLDNIIGGLPVGRVVVVTRNTDIKA